MGLLNKSSIVCFVFIEVTCISGIMKPPFICKGCDLHFFLKSIRKFYIRLFPQGKYAAWQVFTLGHFYTLKVCEILLWILYCKRIPNLRLWPQGDGADTPWLCLRWVLPPPGKPAAHFVAFLPSSFLPFTVHLYLFLRDRVWAGERQRERETQNQPPGSKLSAQSPTRGPNSRTPRSWPELKSDT